MSFKNNYNGLTGSDATLNRVEVTAVEELKEPLKQQAATQKASQEELIKQFASMQTSMMQQMMESQKQMASTKPELLSHLAGGRGNSQETRCYICNGKGHMARNYKKPKKVRNKGVQTN